MNSTLKKDEIYARLLGTIRSGELPQGTKLPAEVELAASFRVGRITLRAALDRLEREGLLIRTRGKGTIIAGDTMEQHRGTILFLYEYQEKISNQCHYMPQELIRFAKECNCKPFLMERKTFELYSIEDIRGFLERERVLGIVILMNNFRGDESILKTLRALNSPVVFVLCSETDPAVTGFPGIGIHERSAMEDAVKFLSKRGVRSMGLLADDMLDFRGWKKEELPELLKHYGIVFREEWYREVAFDPTEICPAVRGFLSGRERPQAILCYTAYFAIHVYAVAKELGLRIPEDLTVMGICGYLGTRLLTPKLATVNFHYDRIAEKAVKMLMNPDENIRKAVFIEIKPNIVEGASIRNEIRTGNMNSSISKKMQKGKS